MKQNQMNPADVNINASSNPAEQQAQPPTELPFAVRHPTMAKTGDAIVIGVVGSIVLAAGTAIITATTIGVRRLLKPTRMTVISTPADPST